MISYGDLSWFSNNKNRRDRNQNNAEPRGFFEKVTRALKKVTVRHWKQVWI